MNSRPITKSPGIKPVSCFGPLASGSQIVKSMELPKNEPFNIIWQLKPVTNWKPPTQENVEKLNL